MGKKIRVILRNGLELTYEHARVVEGTNTKSTKVNIRKNSWLSLIRIIFRPCTQTTDLHLDLIDLLVLPRDYAPFSSLENIHRGQLPPPLISQGKSKERKKS